MLINFFTVFIMLAVAYVYLREGLLTGLTMFINVFLAGLVAFNFFEPLAELLDGPFSSTFLRGYEDLLCLIGLFALTLGILRTVTNTLAKVQITFHPAVQSGGGALLGLATGYLTAGFLLCALQTLPWHERFMYFDPSYDPATAHSFRAVMPPDRVWLGLMYRAGAYAFSNTEDERYASPSNLYERYYTFDKGGTFEMRYARYRRYTDSSEPATYNHELDEEIRGPRD